MTDSLRDAFDAAPRRTLFARLAGGMAGGLGGLVSARAVAATETTSQAWPGALPGEHHLVVDAWAINGGAPLRFAHTFLATNQPAGSAGVVLILRADALPLALESSIWEKYKIGEHFKITDPETRAFALKNPVLHPRPGVLPIEDMALDRLLGAGAIVGACNVALHGLSGALASQAGVSRDEAAQEWTANLVKGVTLLPSGVWGLGRAQAAGCGYCAGG